MTDEESKSNPKRYFCILADFVAAICVFFNNLNNLMIQKFVANFMHSIKFWHFFTMSSTIDCTFWAMLWKALKIEFFFLVSNQWKGKNAPKIVCNSDWSQSFEVSINTEANLLALLFGNSFLLLFLWPCFDSFVKYCVAVGVDKC